MKPFALVLALALAALPAAAQRHKLSEINTETEEGKMLQAIGTEEDAARKLSLMEAFADKFGKHEARGWVLSQMQAAYLKAGNFDKTIATGDQLLGIDADDLDAAYNNLKAAEGKKDGALVLKWAPATSALARKAAAAPKGAEESDEDHKYLVDSAKKTDLYTEYALSTAAFAEADAARSMKLVEALAALNIKSQYLEPALAKYAYAARQANAIPAAVAFGSKALEAGATHEDLLVIMADYHMNQAKDPEKVLAYSDRLVQHLGAKPAPQGIAAPEWDKKKNTMLGLAYWMQGTTYAAQSRHAQTDKALRAALPLIQGNDALTGPALFYLGLANYQTGKGKPQQMSEALKFMQQSAAIRGPFQAKAASNVTAMKQQGVK